MSVSGSARFLLVSSMVVWTTLQTTSVQTQNQQRGGTPQTDKVPAVNTGGNPYRVIRDWAQLNVEGRPWGGSNGVAIDRDGRSVWATDRCSPGTTPGCLGNIYTAEAQLPFQTVLFQLYEKGSQISVATDSFI